MENQIVARELNQKKGRIIEKSAQAFYEVYGDTLAEMGFSLRDVKELSKSDLSKLFVSLISADEKIFLEHVAWKKNVLSSRYVPMNAIEDSLEILSQVTYSELENDSGIDMLEYYFSAAIKSLQSGNERSCTFLSGSSRHNANAKYYLDLLLKNAQKKALDFIEELAAKYDARDIYLQVIQPVQYEIGRLWETNEINVAEEHAATSTTVFALSILRSSSNILDKNGKKILTACVDDERHETGIIFVSDFLRFQGYEVFYCGADTPQTALLEQIEKYGPDLVALSVTMSYYLKRCESVIKSIHDNIENLPVIVGGYVFNIHNSLWKEVGADAFAKDSLGAVAETARLLQVEQPVV